VSETSEVPARKTVRTGLIFAVASYLLWGFLPLYFIVLQPASAFEIVAWRIVFSLGFCAILVTSTRSWSKIVATARQPKLLLTMGLAAFFIYINWQVYVYGATSGRVIETSLGYFINPIVTVLLGVILLRERLRTMQWIAVAISAVAVLVIALNYGAFPWIALTLAFSFGIYGLIKKRIGSRVDALSGLVIETTWLVPIAVAQLIAVSVNLGLTFGSAGGVHALLMVLVGVATAIPLLFFAAASRRLPLVYMGLVQYITPLLQFAIGALLLHEAMPAPRLLGFALVWLALIVLSIDLLLAGRAGRRAAPALA
jgi:chloramphenicol-sensitive protein RarD